MISVSVKPPRRIIAALQEEHIGASVRDVTVRLPGDPYTGEYDVTPSTVEQTLYTSGKTLDRNVVVAPVAMALATRQRIDNMF